MAFTVTATQGGASSNGMSMVLKVITGQATAQPGVTGTTQTATPSLAVTPAGNGSLIYGALLGTITMTTLASTTFIQSGISTLQFVELKSAATTTAGTPVTIGASGSTHGLSLALAEILAAGTLAEDPSSPPAVAVASVKTQTTASFTPPPGSLLVLMVATNGGAGTTTLAVTDTSGLGLNWVQQAVANGNSKGYAGVWTAQAPAIQAAPQPIPPGFISPASIRYTWRPLVPPPAALSAPFTGLAAVSGLFRGVHTAGGGLIFYAELPGPAVKPLSFASPAFSVPLAGPAAAAGTVAAAKTGRDPFTGRVAVSGVMAGVKTSLSAFAGPAAESGTAIGLNPAAGGMTGPSAVSGKIAGSKVAESAFTGTAAAAMTVFGNPPVTGSFAGAASASGAMLAALAAPLIRLGSPYTAWVTGIPETSS